ncbi:MAG: TolC family protein [Ignavibacteria bacterium]|nr:TolC family protein [Ignavibacteria bacterium]MCU7502001.1 TolC family protein [Ignavibacteria bacterium]MCU7516969.1 TolC family protein [Ignavibacteria bacterium]
MKKSIFILLVLFVSGLYAQSTGSSVGGLKVSLSDAITMALQKNKDILISNQDLAKSEAQISEAYGNAMPQVNFTGNYTRNIELPVLFIPPGTPFNQTGSTMAMSLGSNNSYTAGVSANQVLFSAKVNTAIQIAKEYRNYTEFNTTATRENVVDSVKKAYYGVLLLQQVLEASKQGLDLAKANYENVSQLYKQGMASEFDFLRSEVQVANTEPAVSKAENTLELAKNGLKFLLGIDLRQNIELTGALEIQELPQNVLETESQNIVETNSLVQALRSQENILEKNIQIQRADYFPTLAAFGTYQYQTQDNTFQFKNYNWANNFMVGLQINFPIFNGLQTKYRTEQAVIDKDKLVLARMKLEEGLKIQVEAARLSMMEAQKRIAAQQKSVEQAARAVSIAEVRYKNGLGTQIELIDSQVALTRTQINKAQAVYDYLVARSDWERITGYGK